MKKLTNEQLKVQAQEARMHLEQVKNERIEFCKKHKLSDAIATLCHSRNPQAHWVENINDSCPPNNLDDEETAQCVIIPLRGKKVLHLITMFRQGRNCLIGKHFFAHVLDKEIDCRDGAYHLNSTNRVFVQVEENQGAHSRDAVIKWFHPGKWVDVLLRQAEIEKDQQDLMRYKAAIDAAKKDLERWEPTKTKKPRKKLEMI